MGNLITSVEAARRLGITKARVNVLIRAKRLPATRVGIQNLIDPKDLARVRDRRPGRPPKDKAAKNR